MRKYADPQAVDEWRQEHESCAACWRHYRELGVILEMHHMLGGRVGRPDAKWNFIMLCRECHERLGHGRNNLAICLTLKRECDIENYDPWSMQNHLVRFGDEVLVEPAELPDWIFKERS